MVYSVAVIKPCVDGALYPLMTVAMCRVACSVAGVIHPVPSSPHVTGAILACCIAGPIAVHSVIGELASVSLLQIFLVLVQLLQMGHRVATAQIFLGCTVHRA